MNENVKITVKGDVLTLVIDLKTDLGKTSSGKSILIAKCREDLTGKDKGTTVALNVYKK